MVKRARDILFKKGGGVMKHVIVRPICDGYADPICMRVERNCDLTFGDFVKYRLENGNEGCGYYVCDADHGEIDSPEIISRFAEILL